MTLADLKKAVCEAVEYADQCGNDPADIPVTLQLERDPDDGDALWSSDEVEVHYDNNAQASGCVITAWLNKPTSPC